MAFGFRSTLQKLKEWLSSNRYKGVDPERIAIRTQGCWSCVHFSTEKAQNLWWDEARQKLLQKGITLALSTPLGEKDLKVLAIRKGAPQMDAQMTAQQWGCCKVGIKADGTPVDNFVASTFLCRMWTGAQGASVAREGAASDRLPEEELARIHEKKVE